VTEASGAFGRLRTSGGLRAFGAFEGFRAEVRDSLAAHVPAEPLPSFDTAEGFERHRAWERELAAGRPGRAPRPDPAGARVSLTAEQQDLRDAVRGLLASAEDSPWRRLCREVGVAGPAIPERYGGAGAGPAETGVVMEELGRGLTPSPMLGSAVLAAQALLATGDHEACGRLLPAIAAGSATAALAWTSPAGRWDSGGVACVARPPSRWARPGRRST
jgi:alkylation response protein AidB-like acyl-CoA dehydrogenase